MARKITFLAILFFFPFILHAGGPKPEINIVRTESPIQVDGRLDETIWSGLKGISNFKQLNPIEGARPTEKTTVYLTYDRENLYVGAHLYDEAPDSIRALLSRRDVETRSDRFGILLDTYHDLRSGFYFGLSAAGGYFDGVISNEDNFDESWDGVWKGEVQRTTDGWTVEMRIPFSQLRFNNSDSMVWGVNFIREIARKNEEDFLVYQPKKEQGFVSRFALLKGIKNIHSAGRLELLPYVRGKAAYVQTSSDDPFNDGSEYTPDFGVDLKYSLSSNITLNATVNPDFGQVEVDPAVVNLSDVESFFDEKRPFFVDGAATFRFGRGGSSNNIGMNWSNPRFFYSRRIGRAPQGGLPDYDYADVPDGARIIGAGKVYAKLGKNWNVGLLGAFTNKETARIDYNSNRSRVEVEPYTFYGVARAQKEFKRGKHGLGFISTATLRSFDDPRLKDYLNKNALSFGVDGWSFFGGEKTWVLSGWAGYSTINATKTRMIDVQENSIHRFQRPDFNFISLDSNRTSLSGFASRISINKERGAWLFNTAIGVIDPRFDVNDLGFLWSTNVINAHISTGYRWTDPGKYFRSMRVFGAIANTSDFDGNRTSTFGFANMNVTLLNYISFGFGSFYNIGSTNVRRTRGGPKTLNNPGAGGFYWVSSDSRKDFVASLNGSFNFDTNNEKYFNWELEMEWKPADNISFSVSPGFNVSLPKVQWVDAFDDPLSTSTYGRRYIFAAMKQYTFSSGIRLNWTFTPTLSLQLYAQPLVSSADYFDYKYLARPNSYDFRKFPNENLQFSDADQVYSFDPDGAGPAQELSWGNPDFTYKSIRGNAVLRWEYVPGSTLYLVWTQNRSDSNSNGKFSFNHFSDIGKTPADNIFLLKINYWLNM